jgi:hypothetical protein
MPEYISMILRNIMGWWKKDAASMEQNWASTGRARHCLYSNRRRGWSRWMPRERSGLGDARRRAVSILSVIGYRSVVPSLASTADGRVSRGRRVDLPSVFRWSCGEDRWSYLQHRGFNREEAAEVCAGGLTNLTFHDG